MSETSIFPNCFAWIASPMSFQTALTSSATIGAKLGAKVGIEPVGARDRVTTAFVLPRCERSVAFGS